MLKKGFRFAAANADRDVCLVVKFLKKTEVKLNKKTSNYFGEN